MSRATIEQLPQLGLDSDAINRIPPEEKQIALDAAAAWIDGIIGTQFPPLIIPPYPLDLIQCECVLASWTLLVVKGFNPESGKNEMNIEQYKYWRDIWAPGVAKGEIVPPIISTANGGPGADDDAGGPAVITESQRGYSERGVTCPPQVTHTGPFSGN